MLIKGLVEEDFVNYKKPSMFILFPFCTFKCCRECGKDVCQNSDLYKQKNISVSYSTIVNKYKDNNITHAIVFGGMEPFDSWVDLQQLVHEFRKITDDDIVIYTGYKEEELNSQIHILKSYKNIIIKFGRFVPDEESHMDMVLGVKLASFNQYAIRIS